MEAVLLYFDDCPNWQQTASRLDRLTSEFPDLTVTHQLVDTDEAAQRLGFLGSPTILLDGVDLFATSDTPVGLSCRIYMTPAGTAGSPTLEQLRDALGSASGRVE